MVRFDNIQNVSEKEEDFLPVFASFFWLRLIGYNIPVEIFSGGIA